MKKYAISIQDQENRTQYIGGSTEGSYFSLVSSIQRAKWFDDPEQIREIIKTHDEFNKRIQFCDGSSNPPSLIWSGLGICNDRPKADGFINIVEIDVHEIESIYVSDEAK